MSHMLASWHQLNRGPLAGATGPIVALSIGMCLLAVLLLPFVAIPVLGVTLIYVVVLSTANILILSRVMAQLRDVGYSVSLLGFLQRQDWKPSSYFNDGGAASPSLSLLLTKILALCRPRRILELGSGQSTKLLNCYAQANNDVFIRTIEQDKAWHALLSSHLRASNHELILSPLQERRFTPAGMSRQLSTRWYAPKTVGSPEDRFDLILVDGPDFGGLGADFVAYARSGLLEHLPRILADTFAIVFDDAERYGERMTIDATERVLKAAGRQFIRFDLHGVKTQAILVSREWAFLRSV